MPRLVAPLVLLVAASPAVAQEKLTVAQVIARVRENEARYDNLEVRYTERAHTPERNWGNFNITYRSVRQKGMTRVESTCVEADAQRPSWRHRIVFDGTTARINYNGEIETLPRGVRYDSGVSQPHLLAMSDYTFAPLAVWLEGGEDLRTAPGGWPDSRIVTRTAGRDRVHGIDCVRLICECWFFDKRVKWEHSQTRTVWLSPAHNYLPVRWDFADASPAGAVFRTTACDDFREVRRGVWLPYRITSTLYHSDELGRSKGQVVTTEVESVRLDPNYPIEFFRDKALPPLSHLHPAAG